METQKTAIIIGAGPAGLTAAYELLEKTDIIPIVFEMSMDIGGISKTVVYNGNRIDIGGHRFFSRSARVMEWWQNILPIQGTPARDDRLVARKGPLSKCLHRGIGSFAVTSLPAPDPETVDSVMLVRSRVSRIYFLRKLFDYPVTLNLDMVMNLGFVRMFKIGVSYFTACMAPIREEKTLEDFFINRFGGELYRIFFKDYTEKVWGVPCTELKPAWGAQRIKGLSITKSLLHAIRKLCCLSSADISQKGVETSLIEQFLYPKFGPGQMWQEVAAAVKRQGGQVILQARIVAVETADDKVIAVQIRDEQTGRVSRHEGDYFFSTMPVRDLVAAMGVGVPNSVKDVARSLPYRDFITVGLLVNRLLIANNTNGLVRDNWIYIQERDVRVGRLQIFNNWSPYLVKDPEKVWIGVEYFCAEGDSLWSMPDGELVKLAIDELVSINIIDRQDILDATVLRMPKAYPAYFGSYDNFDLVRDFTNGFCNLFLIGRNGMHRYNNMDHSMLTAMAAVENIAAGRTDKTNLWQVNAEQEYHEKS